MDLVTLATNVSIFGFCAARLEKRANRNARARNPVANNGQASGANATEDKRTMTMVDLLMCQSCPRAPNKLH